MFINLHVTELMNKSLRWTWVKNGSFWNSSAYTFPLKNATIPISKSSSSACILPQTNSFLIRDAGMNDTHEAVCSYVGKL